jgi:hypothetical protein
MITAMQEFNKLSPAAVREIQHCLSSTIEADPRACWPRAEYEHAITKQFSLALP